MRVNIESEKILTEKLKKKQGPFLSILFSTHTHTRARARARAYKMKYHKTNDVYTLYTSLVL